MIRSYLLDGGRDARPRQPDGKPFLVEGILDAIADWVNKYRHSFDLHDQFGLCGPEEVTRMAKRNWRDPDAAARACEQGTRRRRSTEQTAGRAARRPGTPSRRPSRPPCAICNSFCISCTDKARCGHELDTATGAERFREFCPNAVTLDMLFNRPAGRPATDGKRSNIARLLACGLDIPDAIQWQPRRPGPMRIPRCTMAQNGF